MLQAYKQSTKLQTDCEAYADRLSVLMYKTCALCVGQAGADAAKAGPGSKQAGVMLQRSKWTAQVGLVLHSQVPSPLAGYVLPPGVFSTLSLSHISMVFAMIACAKPHRGKVIRCVQAMLVWLRPPHIAPSRTKSTPQICPPFKNPTPVLLVNV